MRKISLFLLFALAACSAKNFSSETVESDDIDDEYWRRIEECGFKIYKNDS